MLCKSLIIWLRGVDLNHRPLGYEDNNQISSSLPFQSFRCWCLARVFPWFSVFCSQIVLTSVRTFLGHAIADGCATGMWLGPQSVFVLRRSSTDPYRTRVPYRI